MGDLEYILIWDEENDKEVIVRRGLLDTVVATLDSSDHDGDKENELNFFSFMDANAVDATVDAPYELFDRLPHHYLRSGDREAVVDGIEGFFRKEDCYEIGMPHTIYAFYPHSDFEQDAEETESHSSDPETPAEEPRPSTYDYDEPARVDEDKDDDEDDKEQPVTAPTKEAPETKHTTEQQVTVKRTVIVNGVEMPEGFEFEEPSLGDILLALLGITVTTTTTSTLPSQDDSEDAPQPMPLNEPEPGYASSTVRGDAPKTEKKLRKAPAKALIEYAHDPLEAVFAEPAIPQNDTVIDFYVWQYAKANPEEAHDIAENIVARSVATGRPYEAALYAGRLLQGHNLKNEERASLRYKISTFLNEHPLELIIADQNRAELLHYVKTYFSLKDWRRKK